MSSPNRISVSNPTQPVISVTDEGGVLITVNYQNSAGGGGSGDVVGPSSSTDNAIARYDGTTGKLIQDSGITIADGASGTLSGSNSGDVTLGASVTDIFNLTGQVLSADDQGADRIVFWDESANKLTALTAGSGLSISGTTITATATGDVVGPASSTDNALVRFDGTTGKLVQNGQITESDSGDLAAINSLAFDTTPTGSITTQGEVMWSADDETLDIKLNGFTMHTGQHVLYHVQNNTGSTISKGAPVMYAGTTGNSGKLLVSLWDGTGPSTLFLGLAGEDLANGASGFVVAFGKLRGIQTDGGNYGETWADGDIIYAGTTSGSLTKTQPVAPNPRIQVCSVVHAHASNGTLFVQRTLGSNIKDDEGVTITSLSSGQLLVANAAGTVFENKSMSGDATLANTGALTLATVNSNVGSFGSATAAPAVTVNAKGLVTAVSTNTITPAVGSITGLGTGVATALAVNVGSAGALVTNGGALGTPSSGTLTSCTGLPISTGVSGLGTNVAASLANAMSASGTLAILGANTFTATQTVTPAANTSGLVVSGYSLTGSSTTALLNLSGTWNTTGIAEGLFLNITNTASNAASRLLRLQASGVDRFAVAPTGGVTLRHSASANDSITLGGNANMIIGAQSNAVGIHYQLVGDDGGGAPSFRLASGGSIEFNSTNTLTSGSRDLFIRRGAAGLLSQHNSTNAQAFRVANTFTSATNFEAFTVDWQTTSNVCRVGTIKGSGGGTARALSLITDATVRAVFEATTYNTTLLAAAGSYGSGSGVLFLGNATTAPTTDPTGGGILYVEAGALKYRGSSGTVTTIANA